MRRSLPNREAIELNPEETQAYDFLGDPLLAMGSMEDAIACYWKLNQLDPSNHAAMVRLAFLLLANNDRASYEAIVGRCLIDSELLKTGRPLKDVLGVLDFSSTRGSTWNTIAIGRLSGPRPS